MLKRSLPAAVVVVAVSFMLMGCGPDYTPRARVEGDAMMVVLCAPIDAARIEMLVGPGGSDPYDSDPRWVAEGSHTFGAGDGFTVGVAPSGMKELAPVESFDPDLDRIAIRIVSGATGEDVQVSEWKAGAIPSEQWSNGSATEPCT